MKYLYLTSFLFLASCSTYDVLTTAQNLEVKLNGSDGAYCVLSTADNRYSLRAPGTAYVERDESELKVDCKDNSSPRRRTVMVKSEFALGYWSYPKTVTVDFASAGQVNNGFRLAPSEKYTEVLTEESYSAPVDDTPKLNMQTYEATMQQDMWVEEQSPIGLTPQPDTYVAPTPRQYDGRRSYPVTE